jgi:CHAT domain-containing protein
MQKIKEVYAFSPDYGNTDTWQRELNYLQGAEREIESVLRWFKGKRFTGSEASETNFRKAIQKSAIFHLAMHGISDTLDSRYSCLIFDPQNDETNDGKLYNYEISLSRISSPMIVLSACNSGSGTLYQGEGLMSIARGFLLAGASSVIKTLWDVNDETSALIISRFYYHLSRGKNKDEALRYAKLEYINSHPPVYTNPYYWAAYVVLGDNSPAARNNNTVLIIGVLLIIIAGAVIIYFRRRTIFSAPA